MKLAAALLDSPRYPVRLAAGLSAWWRVCLAVATCALGVLGATRAQVEEWVRLGRQIDPTYYPLYLKMAEYLLPRWHGQRGDVELGAQHVARQHVDAEGHRTRRAADGHADEPALPVDPGALARRLPLQVLLEDGRRVDVAVQRLDRLLYPVFMRHCRRRRGSRAA